MLPLDLQVREDGTDFVDLLGETLCYLRMRRMSCGQMGAVGGEELGNWNWNVNYELKFL